LSGTDRELLMLIDDLKKRMFEAMKTKEIVAKEIVRTAIGEITSTGADPTDERVLSVLRKLVKSNEETRSVSQDAAVRSTLEEEIRVLREFLPSSMTVEQIRAALADVRDQVRAAGNDGQAMGVAMKALKSQSATVESQDVKEAVKQLRAAG
jgi:uncharacterized protein YqeY